MNTDTENLKLSLDAHALVALGDALDAADEGGCAEVDDFFAGIEDVADVVVGVAHGVIEAGADEGEFV